MKKLLEGLKIFAGGFMLGSRYTAKVLHLPVWVGVLVSFILIPINIITLLIWRIFNKEILKELSKEIDDFSKEGT